MKHSRTHLHRVVLLSPQTKLQKFLKLCLSCSALKYITTDITSSNLRLMPFSYRFLQFRLCSNKTKYIYLTIYFKQCLNEYSHTDSGVIKSSRYLKFFWFISEHSFQNMKQIYSIFKRAALLVAHPL